MTNILKTVTTVLSMFNLESLDERKRIQVRSSGIGEMEGSFMVKVSLKESALLAI